MNRLIAVLAMALLATASPAQSQQYVAGGFPATEIDLAQVPATVSGNPVRRVIADKLPLYTRPIPEAAVLDRLDVGARVPLVTEGGGWATMDLGGGFLGWMRIEGLGADLGPPPRPAAAAPVALLPKTAPKPAVRPVGLGGHGAESKVDLTAVDDAVAAPRIKRF